RVSSPARGRSRAHARTDRTKLRAADPPAAEQLDREFHEMIRMGDGPRTERKSARRLQAVRIADLEQLSRGEHAPATVVVHVVPVDLEACDLPGTGGVQLQTRLTREHD